MNLLSQADREKVGRECIRHAFALGLILLSLSIVADKFHINGRILLAISIFDVRDLVHQGVPEPIDSVVSKREGDYWLVV